MARRAACTIELTDEHRGRRFAQVDARQVAVVLKAGRAVTRVVVLSDPELNALQGSAIVSSRFFGVRDAVSRRHQVEFTGADDLFGAQGVAMQRLAVDEPRDGLQARVGVGSDIEAAAFGDVGGTHVIREAPRSHGSTTALWEGAAHLERANLGIVGAQYLEGHGVGSVIG